MNNLEEDMEILENWLKKLNELFNKTHINNTKERKALCHILSDYKRVLKENEELKTENSKLREIKYTTDYGTETVNLIPKSTLVEINTNRYMIEIEDGKFVDLKQVYQENKTLKEVHIQDNKHLDFIIKECIPKDKIKEILEETEITDFNSLVETFLKIKKLLESE